MQRLLFSAVLCLLTCFAFVSPANAQVADSLSPMPRLQFFNSSGQPLSGGFVYTYVSGSNTPLATYVDSGGVILASNPIVLDSGGMASIWLATGSIYRITVADANNVQQWSVDGVQPPPNLLGPGPIGTQTPNIVESTEFLTGTANPALSGLVRLASVDQVCWRNNANSADLCLNKDGSDILNWPSSFAITGVGTFAQGLSTPAQIISTLPTGTAPFSIASSTTVTNLSANFVEDSDWANPGTIGATTPNTGKFTTLRGVTSVQIGTSTPLTSDSGNSAVNATAAASLGGASAGTLTCADGSGNIAASSCTIPYVNWGLSTSCPSVTGTGSIQTCTINLNATEANTSYKVSCTGGGTITGYPFLLGVSTKATGSVTITYSNGTASEAVTSSWGEVDCVIVR